MTRRQMLTGYVAWNCATHFTPARLECKVFFTLCNGFTRFIMSFIH